ncbi:hypothetical protein HUJ04_007906 [Dendroctonus ponderosae]|nr:hypothetical protein HUJ04_007906 [Dendroctonus ponderosae]
MLDNAGTLLQGRADCTTGIKPTPTSAEMLRCPQVSAKKTTLHRWAEGIKLPNIPVDMKDCRLAKADETLREQELGESPERGELSPSKEAKMLRNTSCCISCMTFSRIDST